MSVSCGPKFSVDLRLGTSLLFAKSSTYRWVSYSGLEHDCMEMSLEKVYQSHIARALNNTNEFGINSEINEDP